MSESGATEAPRIPGRVQVSERALRRLLGALAAEELGVEEKDVQARVSDVSGRLAVRIEAPIAAAPLAAASSGTSLLTRTDSVRARVNDEGSRLSGAAIGSVHVRVTSAHIDERRRVS